MVTNPIPHLIFWGVLLIFGFMVGRYHARHTILAWAESRRPTPLKMDDRLRAITALLVVLAVARTQAEQVQGRRTGLSECAFPFGQTERRAKRTLDRPPP